MSEMKSSALENENFEALLEENLKSLDSNGRVEGTVVSIAPNEVYVEVVGRKQTGVIPIEELSAVPVSDPNEVVKVGDVLELLILKTNDVEGTILLSKRKIDSQKGFEELQQACESREVLTGIVTEVVNGGVIVVAKGARIFVPASQVSLQNDVNLEEMVGQEVQLRLIEASRRGRRTKVIGSIKSVLREEANAQRSAFWENVELGKTYTGIVKNLTNYGAFVDLGGITGMIHISELSWLRIKHPSEVVNVGDSVEVYIKDLDKEKKKISLGFKKAEENPWLILKENYPVDSVVKVKIVSLTAFGAFANIITGIDGLIHISQISYDRIEKPADVLKVGDEVEAKITAIDFENRKVSLSMKALLPEPVKEEVAAKEEKVESTEDEVVASFDETGAVTIADSIEIPELTDEVPPVEDEPSVETKEEAPVEETADAETTQE